MPLPARSIAPRPNCCNVPSAENAARRGSPLASDPNSMIPLAPWPTPWTEANSAKMGAERTASGTSRAAISAGKVLPSSARSILSLPSASSAPRNAVPSGSVPWTRCIPIRPSVTVASVIPSSLSAAGTAAPAAGAAGVSAAAGAAVVGAAAVGAAADGAAAVGASGATTGAVGVWAASGMASAALAAITPTELRRLRSMKNPFGRILPKGLCPWTDSGFTFPCPNGTPTDRLGSVGVSADTPARCDRAR